MELSESLENYLEVILGLEEKNKVARAKSIAEKMEVKRASVTSALKSLSEKGLIDYKPYGFITLKPKGKKIAKKINERRLILKNFFKNVLRLDEETANTVACKMEHTTEKKFIERLLSFIEFINRCPKAGKDWIDSFIDFCSSNEKLSKKRCEDCLEKNMKILSNN